MDQSQIQMFVTTNAKWFDASKMPMIIQKLESLDSSKQMLISAQEYKDPTTMLLISLFLGYLGIDRFMLKDTGMGILKLLTCGVCGILTLIDWFSIQQKTRDYNYNLLMSII